MNQGRQLIEHEKNGYPHRRLGSQLGFYHVV